MHPEHGYKGATPQRGEKAAPANRLDKVSHFKGNEVRDGRGHVSGVKVANTKNSNARSH